MTFLLEALSGATLVLILYFTTVYITGCKLIYPYFTRPFVLKGNETSLSKFISGKQGIGWRILGFTIPLLLCLFGIILSSIALMLVDIDALFGVTYTYSCSINRMSSCPTISAFIGALISLRLCIAVHAWQLDYEHKKHQAEIDAKQQAEIAEYDAKIQQYLANEFRNSNYNPSRSRKRKRKKKPRSLTISEDK
ncbi:hypothetical protein QE250_08695 [Chromatiaceae bacterium AAb-1]|nr:hypothetical protein [Chromatiaceae bacterium AAb-1]